MMATGGAHYDIARYGMEVFRASPRQADLMIVAGRVSQKMAPVLRQIYDQMMEPKWVISMGVCASSGGMFNNYAIVQGVDQVVPVDVYAPGCPPGPETLLHAIFTLHEKIRAASSPAAARPPRSRGRHRGGTARRPDRRRRMVADRPQARTGRGDGGPDTDGRPAEDHRTRLRRARRRPTRRFGTSCCTRSRAS